MHTHRFGKKIKLPSTIAIKHQIRKLMWEDLVKETEVIARAEAIRRSLGEETLHERGTKALRVKPYPRPRAARQPPAHLQTIAGGKAKNRSPRPTRKTGTRFTRRRTRRRKSDNSCDGTRKKARNKSRAFVISVEGGLNSPCRPCRRQA